jgi:hypothetical protein
MVYPVTYQAQLSAVPQQPGNEPHEVAPGEQLAPGRSIHLELHINEILAHAGYVDVKMTHDPKDAGKELGPAVKAHVKMVVPHLERIGRRVKFETLTFETMVHRVKQKLNTNTQLISLVSTTIS